MAKVMAAPSFSRMLLRDGRHLAWREYGVAEGFAVIFSHGNLNSRLFEAAWDKTDAITKEAGVRLIAVDRPGYGESSFLEKRAYSSWADDLSQLCQELQLGPVALLGYSSGGPNSMAAAARMPAGQVTVVRDRHYTNVTA